MTTIRDIESFLARGIAAQTAVDAALPYVIWSFEHDAWWRPGAWGYTSELAEAGHYTRAEAERIVAHANIVAVNEQALLLTDAQAAGPPRKP